MKFYGETWGGTIEVGVVRSTTGRILIDCTTQAGKSFCITISRWLHERRAGNIVPVGGVGAIARDEGGAE